MSYARIKACAAALIATVTQIDVVAYTTLHVCGTAKQHKSRVIVTFAVELGPRLARCVGI